MGGEDEAGERGMAPGRGMRVGIGFDMHRLVLGRRLVLGGVAIPFERGLEGHSDADVLTHAIIDALLGAAGERDIGACFGTEDPKYKDVSSLRLLEEAYARVLAGGYRAHNVDATIIAEAPRLGPHIPEMARTLALALGVGAAAVNIKATTAKGMGLIGSGEGIACMAVALLDGVPRQVGP